MFVGKVRSLPYRGAPERCFTQVGSTRLEKLAKDKCSSLLQNFVTYGCKRFYKIGHRCSFHKQFMSVTCSCGKISWCILKTPHAMNRFCSIGGLQSYWPTWVLFSSEAKHSHTKFWQDAVIIKTNNYKRSKLKTAIFSMEQRTFKNVNNCLNTNIYSYLETSGGQSYNLYLNVVHFFNTSLN